MEERMMPAQEGPKRKPPAPKPDEETRVAIEQARADAKAALTRAKEEERARRKVEATLAEAQEALAVAQVEIEQQRRARVEAEKALAEAQEALAVAQVEIEQARQERVKTEQVRAEAERALAEARKATGGEAEKMDLLPTALGNGGAEQRVSFIVRLTVDERGQPRRTEIEHAQSGKKQTFPTLDVQRLTAFMKARISPPAIPEPTIPPAPLPGIVGFPTSEPPRPASDLTVSDVWVFRIGTPGVSALMLNPAEACVVQVHFHLQGPEAHAITAQEPSFEIRVYTHEVTSGASKLLSTHSASLVEDVFGYTAQIQAPGLPPGIYRLVTLVALHAPAKLVAHYEGPVIQVVEVQPSVSTAAPLELSLSG
jgi:hypothetical protein